MLTYNNNRANSKQVYEHISRCNFDPPLHTYLNLDSYIDKILKNANRFECWDAGSLVGLVAVYCNDYTNHRSFVTLVSVDNDHQRQGIAKTLMAEAQDYCRANEFKTMALEVYRNNMPAIHLYEKDGFAVEKESANALIMVKDLSANNG